MIYYGNKLGLIIFHLTLHQAVRSLFPYFLHKHCTWIFSGGQYVLIHRCVRTGHCVDEPLSVPATDTEAAWQTTRSSYVTDSCPPRLHLPAQPNERESRPDRGQWGYDWCEHTHTTAFLRWRNHLTVSRTRRGLVVADHWLATMETATNHEIYGRPAGKSAWDNSETNIS